jgi:hypothetical protein
MRRRSFLALGHAMRDRARRAPRVVGSALASAPGPTPTAIAMRDALGFFTAEQAVTMEAMLERLLPSDVPAGTPGARETRVLRYLDGQLGTPRFPQYRDLFRDGLAALDAIAHAKSAVRFHELPAATRTTSCDACNAATARDGPPRRCGSSR